MPATVSRFRLVAIRSAAYTLGSRVHTDRGKNGWFVILVISDAVLYEDFTTWGLVGFFPGPGLEGVQM